MVRVDHLLQNLQPGPGTKIGNKDFRPQKGEAVLLFCFQKMSDCICKYKLLRKSLSMVERPIKKSEREAMAAASHSSEEGLEAQPGTIEDIHDSNSESSVNQDVPRPRPVKDRSKGKGKGRGEQKDQQSGRQPPMNPALMRGPKPTKPKAPVIQANVDEATEESEAVGEPEET